MDHSDDLQTMLDQLSCPAFLANGGQITAVNTGASQRMAKLGMPVSGILVTGTDEYEAFESGCLYATLTLGGTLYRCTVTKLREQELFCLDEQNSSGELQALALAASQLRLPLSELTLALDRLRSDDQELLAMMNQTIYRLQRMIGNMSDAAAFVHAAPQRSMQEMNALFQSILEKAEAMLCHCGITLQYQLFQQPVYSLADPDMLSRAVYNLLSNASKYALENSVIDVTLKKIGSKLYLTVRDHGEGVKSALRGTMFSRYKRQPGIEDPRHGMGLGMTLIHAAATAHGGTVLVEHPEGAGTKITMSLAIDKNSQSIVRTPILKPDIYGGQDQALIELSDILPHTLYDKHSF